MSIKTITVTEDAYTAIKRLKTEDESFSKLFIRIGSRQCTIKDIAGKLKSTPAEYEEFVRRVREVRENLGKGFEERAKYLRSRFKRSN